MKTWLKAVTLIALGIVASHSEATPKQAAALALIGAGYSPKVSATKISTDFLTECQVERYKVTGQDPIDLKPRSLILHSFKGASGNSKAVILMPPITGTTDLEVGISEALCQDGVRAVIVEKIERDENFALEIATYDRVALKKLAAIRHAAEYLAASGAKEIGVLGISAGGLAASLALGVEAKIRKAALIGTGLDLAEVVVDSTEATQAKLRDERMRRLGFKNREEYLAALKAGITLDNSDFIGFSGPKRVWMSVMNRDTVVPTRTQLALAKALKPEKLVTYDSNHIDGIIQTFANEREAIVRFFKN